MLLAVLDGRPVPLLGGGLLLLFQSFPAFQQGAFETRQARVRVPLLPPASCVASGKRLYLSEPHLNRGACLPLPGGVLGRMCVFSWGKLVLIPEKCFLHLSDLGPRGWPLESPRPAPRGTGHHRSVLLLAALPMEYGRCCAWVCASWEKPRGRSA